MGIYCNRQLNREAAPCIAIDWTCKLLEIAWKYADMMWADMMISFPTGITHLSENARMSCPLVYKECYKGTQLVYD